jgi:glycosyltransferase involved in cell wall biosynthesis
VSSKAVPEQSCNFVTNLPLAQTSGGWSAISARIHEQLERFLNVRFVGPISPPYPTIGKAWSKIRRTAGLHGNFTLFSKSRLRSIRKQYNAQRDVFAEWDFFHGATPWISCEPSGRYATYVDATFPMYLDIYSTPKSFATKDVDRISRREEDWLRNCDTIFFGSDWVRQQAISDYGLEFEKCHVAWVGGHATIPEADTFSGSHRFLFISLDFERKGGLLCATAIQEVRAKFPDIELLIIGQQPPEEVLAMPGIQYAGFLRKTEPIEYAQFCQYLATARGLIHPTSMDTMGMVLIESGYYGCPSIATRRFGIPELVNHEQSGFLLDVPVRHNQLVDFITRLCNDDEQYQAMRQNAREFTTSTLTWTAFGDRISKAMALGKAT